MKYIIAFFREMLKSAWRLMRPMRPIVTRYFKDHPEAMDGVIKAWYAYHAPHFRIMPEVPLHQFSSTARESRCLWCDRSREEVRHDDLPAACGRRPRIRSIKDVIEQEEIRALELVEHARRDVPKRLAKMGLSGDTLAILHHTYGYDPETVASVVEVPPQLLADYHAAMEAERERSRIAQKKTAITIKVADEPR